MDSKESNETIRTENRVALKPDTSGNHIESRQSYCSYFLRFKFAGDLKNQGIQKLSINYKK